MTINWTTPMPARKKIALELFGAMLGIGILTGILSLWMLIFGTNIPYAVSFGIGVFYGICILPTMVFYKLCAHETRVAIIFGVVAPLTLLALIIHLVAWGKPTAYEEQ